ncbi:chloroperoxidase [Thioalkalivibrio nitratireducens DSM 14787]|uniref:Chloroperoxidase n=2 Tax=Thioalkalivibrio nitratireducens TaxID=186931 RepID=L0DT73_THIND|nr:chloroperoxidase [Thioalkalivibrio nitratireducens DSM 14787]
MNWEQQVEDPELAKEFRMITFDLRGHGMSDKPEEAGYYRDSKRWAGDVAAIIENLDLVDPVLVASSMGGRVVGDYVAYYGEAGIGGLMFVGAILMDDAARWFGPATKHLVPMTSADLGTAIDATKHFIDSFFVNAPSEDEVRTLIAYNMMTPRHVRKALLGREADYERHWRELTVPVLLFHGVEDQVIELGMSESAAELIEHAQTSYIDGIGHLPFLEVPERFNTKLAEFVRKVGED